MNSPLVLPRGGELFAPRVEAGWNLLDVRKPGWRAQVNSALLDVAASDMCVLGQLYGSYTAGLHFIVPASGSSRQHQFAQAHGFLSCMSRASSALLCQGGDCVATGGEPLALDMCELGLAQMRPVAILTETWKAYLLAA